MHVHVCVYACMFAHMHACVRARARARARCVCVLCVKLRSNADVVRGQKTKQHQVISIDVSTSLYQYRGRLCVPIHRGKVQGRLVELHM